MIGYEDPGYGFRIRNEEQKRVFFPRNVLFNEDHFPCKIQEEGNKSSIKSSHTIIDSILQENEDTFCGEEPCDKTGIREGISPNEMEMASSCLRRSQNVANQIKASMFFVTMKNILLLRYILMI